MTHSATTTGTARASDGSRIAFQVLGSGPPLVLLAGQANSHLWWEDVRLDFADRHTTITLDYRGTGASDPATPGVTTSTFADDVAAVLAHLDCGPVDLYATSMGGRVGQQFALAHPDQLRRLVLGCTSPGGPHAVERGPEIRDRLGAPGAAGHLLELMYTPQWLSENPGPYRVLGDPTMTPASRRAHLRASDGHDAWDALPSITAPTLILHGADDLMTPAVNAVRMAERIPGSRVHVVPGLRHAFFDEGRAELSPLVGDFLAG